ncbi:hypothetical protein K239x_30090 [Planctomycetes bacterium K23_9]|uniref:Uncharacterized protein n=1 Tax=Stieleria marina TaxID=1930275 RepID=A0A517NV66_9BACT|nr:hypothetical protein K239x_30090 [Planctomycetes bacterium K23_9]
MVAMDPSDPETVERARAVIREHADIFGVSFRSAVYLSWLRLKDVGAVKSLARVSGLQLASRFACL